MSKLTFLKKIDKNTALVGIAAIAIVITGALIFSNSSQGFSLPNVFGLSADQVAKTAVDYINNNNLADSTASLVSVAEESGLVKIKIKIGEREYDSYATKDGKLLLPSAYNMAGEKETNNQNANNEGDTNQPATPLAKSDSPMLEAYVVARCPFGLQMQRAMADAVEKVPDLAKYIKSMYIGAVSADGKTITSMHGEVEATENLRQICIREEQPAKFWPYVACQMKAAGQESACEKSTGVNSAKLSACISDPAKGVAYAKKDFDLNTKYGITGSPTLILNEAKVSESSYGGRSSDAIRAMVCAASNTEPSFCSQKLNTAGAASSFSQTYEGSGSSANSAAGCAPAQ